MILEYIPLPTLMRRIFGKHLANHQRLAGGYCHSGEEGPVYDLDHSISAGARARRCYGYAVLSSRDICRHSLHFPAVRPVRSLAVTRNQGGTTIVLSLMSTAFFADRFVLNRYLAPQV